MEERILYFLELSNLVCMAYAYDHITVDEAALYQRAIVEDIKALFDIVALAGEYSR